MKTATPHFTTSFVTFHLTEKLRNITFSYSDENIIPSELWVTLPVHTRNEQEPEASAQNWASRTVWFDKLDGPILSTLTTVRSTVDSDEGILLLAKCHLTKGRNKNHDNFEGCGGG
jgi:hypothetical protein